VLTKLKNGDAFPFDLNMKLPPDVIRVGNELSLLNIFLKRLADVDPDMLVVFLIHLFEFC
jgi:hypothetical protein